VIPIKIKTRIFFIAFFLKALNYEITPEPTNSSSIFQATNCPSVIADCGFQKKHTIQIQIDAKLLFAILDGNEFAPSLASSFSIF
jgi:hypothetical protein